MDFHALKLFLHLSSSLHFGKTAASCHISPSALSRTIQRIENELGQTLLFRDQRSVSLSLEMPSRSKANSIQSDRSSNNPSPANTAGKKKRGKKKKSKMRNLLERLQQYQEAVLTFMYD